MSSNVLKFTESLQAGLRRDERVPINTPALVECVNAKASPHGLVTYDAVSDPFASGQFAANSITIAHPWPQIFHGKEHTILADETAIFEVTLTPGAWTLTPIVVYKTQTSGSEALTNNSLDAGAAGVPTSWAHGGSGWTWYTLWGNDNHAPNTTGTVSQLNGVMANAITVGRLYRCVYTVQREFDATTAIGAEYLDQGTNGKGFLQIGVGSTGLGRRITRPGVVTEDVICAGTNNFLIKATDLGCSVLEVSLKELGAETIPTDGPWQFADMGDTWMLFNGSCVIFRAPWNGEHYCETNVQMKAGWADRGRLLYANFDNTTFFNSTWDDFIFHTSNSSLVAELPAGLTDITSLNVNTVWWTSINSGDYFFPFFKHLATHSFTGIGYSANYDFLLDHLQKNEMGFMSMPFPGEVLGGHKLGEGCVVYGDDGIAYMHSMVEPAPGYGVRLIYNKGILGRGAFGGDDKQQIFVDEAGRIFLITADNIIPQKIGYEFYISDALATDITISYDPQENEFYISGGTFSFLLNMETLGLSVIPQIVTSLSFTEGGLVGVFSARSDLEFRASTVPFDGGTRAIKTIRHIHVSSSAVDDLTIAISWRISAGDAWAITSYVAPNVDGTVLIPVSGSEFKIHLKITSYTNMDEIDDLSATITMGEKYAVKELI